MANSLLHLRVLEWTVIFEFQDWAILAPSVVYGCAGIMYAQMYVYNSLVPRPSHSFPSFAVRLSRRGPGIFSHMSDVTDRPNYANVDVMWITNNFAHMHILERNYSESKDSSTQKLFKRQSGGHRTLALSVDAVMPNLSMVFQMTRSTGH